MSNITLSKRLLDYHLSLRYFAHDHWCYTESVECVLLFLATANLVYVMFLLKKHTSLHPHFRVLCFSDCIGNLIFIGLRLYLILDNLVPFFEAYFSQLFYKVICCLCIGVSQHFLIVLVLIFFERWWSISHASKYENSYKPILLGLALFLMWISCILFAAGYSVFPEQNYNQIFFCAHLVFAIGFVILFFYNKRLLNRHEYKSVSHAFQIRENIKTIKMMTVTGLLVISHYSICVVISGFCAKYDYNLNTIEEYLFWKEILFAFFSIRLFILPNVVVFFFLRSRASNSVSNVQRKSKIGIIDDEKTLYFNELRRQWGIS